VTEKVVEAALEAVDQVVPEVGEVLMVNGYTDCYQDGPDDYQDRHNKGPHLVQAPFMLFETFRPSLRMMV